MRLTRADWVRLLLLWLGGINMRLCMLAVPPLIPLIHQALNLDEKSVGALVSGPVLVLAIASVPGSLLIAKLGVRGALFAGLGAIAVFGALRGFGPSIPVLFGATFLMGVGVAVTQPAFPSIVREWFPRRIAIATAVYSNGILIGETLPNALTTPFGVLPAAHGGWRCGRFSSPSARWRSRLRRRSADPGPQCRHVGGRHGALARRYASAS